MLSPEAVCYWMKVHASHHLCFFRVRLEVPTCTSWKAPIIWEGMFDPKLYDQTHREYGSSVALTVFAVGRFVPLPRWIQEIFPAEVRWSSEPSQ